VAGMWGHLLVVIIITNIYNNNIYIILSIYY